MKSSAAEQILIIDNLRSFEVLHSIHSVEYVIKTYNDFFFLYTALIFDEKYFSKFNTERNN